MINVAIDGPAGAGKSTVARAAAKNSDIFMSIQVRFTVQSAFTDFAIILKQLTPKKSGMH